MLSMLRRPCVSAVSSIIIIPNNNNSLFPLRHCSSYSSVSANKIDLPPDFFLNLAPTSPPYVVPPEAFKSTADAYWHFRYMRSQCISPISCYNQILDYLLKHHQYDDILSLVHDLESDFHWNDILYPDSHTHSMLIVCHARIGSIYSAFELLHKIINSYTGIHPTTSALNALFQDLCLRREVLKVMVLYHYIILKGFQLNRNSYEILTDGLCRIGETQTAIKLLRLMRSNHPDIKYVHQLYHTVIFRLCKDRLVKQAYDLYSEMIVNKINPGDVPRLLVYGHCILGQFKQAIGLFRRGESVTEGEVKNAKNVVAVMVKGGVRPSLASYLSVVDELYKSERVHKIAAKVDRVLSKQPYLEH